MRIKILLNSVDKVKSFVGVAQGFSGDIDVLSGKYIIDGKSIMGLLSLDLTRELELVLMGDTKETEVSFKNALTEAGLI